MISFDILFSVMFQGILFPYYFELCLTWKWLGSVVILNLFYATVNFENMMKYMDSPQRKVIDVYVQDFVFFFQGQSDTNHRTPVSHVS